MLGAALLLSSSTAAGEFSCVAKGAVCAPSDPPFCCPGLGCYNGGGFGYECGPNSTAALPSSTPSTSADDAKKAGYWVCGAGDTAVNGLYTMCDTYDTYALNGTCLKGNPKQLMFCESTAEPNAQWQIYTFRGALQKKVYHYLADARFDCMTAPVFPVAKGWANVTAADGAAAASARACWFGCSPPLRRRRRRRRPTECPSLLHSLHPQRSLLVLLSVLARPPLLLAGQVPTVGDADDPATITC
jgi:hypothetical protein